MKFQESGPIGTTITATDASGISWARYRWNDSNCNTNFNPNGEWVTVPGRGTHTLHVCVGDITGRTTTETYRFFQYDNSTPSVPTLSSPTHQIAEWSNEARVLVNFTTNNV